MVYLNVGVYDGSIENSVGGMGYSGSFKTPIRDGLNLNEMDSVEIFVWNKSLGEYYISNLDSSYSETVFKVFDVASKSLRGFVRENVTAELLFRYWLDNKTKISLHWESNSEDVNTPNQGVSVKLSYKFINPDSVVVTADDGNGGTVTFTRGVDYDVDIFSGFLRNKTIDPNTYPTLSVSYDYYMSVDLEDVVYYLLLNYFDDDFVVDDFGDDRTPFRVVSYNINDALFDVLNRIAHDVGGRVWIDDNKLYFGVNSSFADTGDTVEDGDVVNFKRAVLVDRVINDVHVFGKKTVVQGEENFQGDGTSTTFYLSKVPDKVEEVWIYFDGDATWKKVPYYDGSSNRYNWRYDSVNNAVIFDEAPPVSGATVVGAFEKYPDWKYAYEVTITNPNSEDVNLVGKITLGEGGLIPDFPWDKVKADGSDIIIVGTSPGVGDYMEIPREFLIWDYGNKAEIWFGGKFIDVDGQTYDDFVVPANSSVTVYLMFGNAGANVSYGWDKIPIEVIVDSHGKFSGQPYVGYYTIEFDPNYDCHFTEFCQDVAAGALETSECWKGIYWNENEGRYYARVGFYYTVADSGYNNTLIGALMRIKTPQFSGEVVFKNEHYMRITISNYGCNSNTYGCSIAIDGQGIFWCDLGSCYGNEYECECSTYTDGSIFRKYLSDSSSVLSLCFRRRTEIGDEGGSTSVGIDYWIIRPDGASACTYSVGQLVTNLKNNIQVKITYSVPSYYNSFNNGSIESYGKRSVRFLVNYVDDVNVLKQVGDNILTAFSEPPLKVNATVRNSLFNGVSWKVGNIVDLNLQDISSKFIINKIKINVKGISNVELLEVPQNYDKLIGLVGGMVLFNLDVSKRLGLVELGDVKYVNNIIGGG